VKYSPVKRAGVSWWRLIFGNYAADDR